MSTLPGPAPAPPTPASGGLTAAEAAARLAADGPNALPEEPPHRLRDLARRFWGAVPWMLEATIALDLFLGRRVEAAVFALLLVLNAVVGAVQEGRARSALAALRAGLAPRARALRDGQWARIDAASLVRGDVVHLRVGDVVPADVSLLDGALSSDESALTGESLPVERTAGEAVFSGAVLVRGEATGVVTATGSRTAYGRTAALVQAAGTGPNRLEAVVVGIVRALVAVDLALVAVVLADAAWTGRPWHEVVPFALILLVASVPVALPAMFTLAGAVGAVGLAGRGVLTARLAAVEEAAAMTVLCTDKTGTLTANRLAAGEPVGLGGTAPDRVLALALAASDLSSQDPLDLAIAAAAKARGLAAAGARESFAPFDPQTKRTEAVVREGTARLRVVKGAPAVVAALAAAEVPVAEVERLAARGARVLAVAAGPDGGPLALAGLLGLEDPPRPDSAAVVGRLQELGLRVVMITGDGPATARSVARAVGIGDRVLPAAELDARLAGGALDFDAVAGVAPEHKFRLVAALQRGGHVVGMTGDGVNDAAALRQAEVGIAVAGAADVARAAAATVLTAEGLSGTVAIVEESRRIYQRMVTYVLNKVVKTFQVALFLAGGFVLEGGRYVTTPTLVALLLVANDFATMSLATDRVTPSAHPDRWEVRHLLATAAAVAAPLVALTFGLYALGVSRLGMGGGPLHAATFLWLVLSGQATIYVVRARGASWRTVPSRALAAATFGAAAGACALALGGVLMAPVPPAVVLGLLLASLGYLAVAFGLARMVERLGRR